MNAPLMPNQGYLYLLLGALLLLLLLLPVSSIGIVTMRAFCSYALALAIAYLPSSCHLA